LNPFCQKKNLKNKKKIKSYEILKVLERKVFILFFLNFFYFYFFLGIMVDNREYCQDDGCASFIPCNKHHMDGNPQIIYMYDADYFRMSNVEQVDCIMMSLKSLVIFMRKLHNKNDANLNIIKFWQTTFDIPEYLSSGTDCTVGREISVWMTNQMLRYNFYINKRIPTPAGLVEFLKSVQPSIDWPIMNEPSIMNFLA
jgi:hypothetical protein